MATVTMPVVRRRAGRDSLMVWLAVAQAVVLVSCPSAPAMALGVWWNSNTISHYFIHRPFFRRRGWNVAFAAFLSVLLGVPQSLWRDRHLAHHAGVRPRLRVSTELLAQGALVMGLWTTIAVRAPHFALTVYLPGFLAGLALCALHGHYEHARGTTSYYGRLYNFLFFNDGYHAEHHDNPGLDWSALEERRAADARVSSFPAPLRWMELFSLDGLERLVLRMPWLQRAVLRQHRRAFERLVDALPGVGTALVVGGGLFPRTAILLRQLLPSAKITILDADRGNLDRARAFLDGADIDCRHGRYLPSDDSPFDLVVIPLAFVGDREAIYRCPPAPAVLVHDWIWNRRGSGRAIPMLLKRLNLVQR